MKSFIGQNKWGGDPALVRMAPFSIENMKFHEENLVGDNSQVQDRNPKNYFIYVPKPAVKA